MTAEELRQLFSKNLNHQLYINGKKAVDLTNDLGFTQPTVSSWVNGKKYPRIDKVQILAEYFGCKITDLVGTEAQHITETFNKRTTDIKKRYDYLLEELDLRNADYYYGDIKLDETDVELLKTMLKNYSEMFENVIRSKYGK